MLASRLRRWLAELEGDASLGEPEQFRRRVDALELLDGRFAEALTAGAEFAVMQLRAQEIRARLEAANEALVESIRGEIARGDGHGEVLGRIRALAAEDEPAIPRPGLAFDWLDELVGGILELGEPDGDAKPPGPEMVFYQPTPARHILRLIEVAGLTGDDVFVDLGSGLGHVALLISILTSARAVGVEVEAAYLASARECAARLRLGRAVFVEGDARRADFSVGTVFYLYTPFTGSMLAEVLARLRTESAGRAIRICTLGPCALVVAEEGWLRPAAEIDPDRIGVFYSS
jgi:SAM-dependent methyltransferase